MPESQPQPIERTATELYAATPLSPEVILDRTLSSVDTTIVTEKQRARAKAMAQHLATFLEPRYLNPRIRAVMSRLPKEVIEGDTGETTVHITARVTERIRRAVHFFALPSPTWPHSPLVRMAESFDLLTVPEDPHDRDRLNTAIERYMNDIIVLAFEQQWQDPPQFVSHDWGHSLRIADLAKQFATALSGEEAPERRFAASPLVMKMCERYQITAQEVEFILDHTHMCHDCGYPHLKGRNKSLHAMDSAELALSDNFVDALSTMIQSPNAKLDVLRQDMYEAIFYHGADVPQDRFQVRIETDRGTFLATNARVADAIAGLIAPGFTPTTKPRTIRRVDIAGAQRAEDISATEEMIRRAVPDAEVQRLVGSPFFIGRKFDLVTKGDELGGVEYIHADAGERPLLTLLRVADNMDLTSDRLGRVRHHPAYYEVIRRIGRNGKDHTLYAQLERAYNKRSADIDSIRRRIREALGTAITDTELEALTTAKEARDWLCMRVVNEILAQEKYANIPSAKDVDPADHDTITRERIIETCYEMRSDVLEHQGGCLAISKIELVRNGDAYNFILHFNRRIFDTLRKIEFQEPGYDARLERVSYNLNVAEYQRWRLEQALISNTVRSAHGAIINIGLIMIYSDNGERILPLRDEDTED
ncbi:MAG: hypothetical protein KIH62_002790 [Candidatus Kerfeldbacteria bacterium]|nr:hypothetical protein [Candidatus Kerfeldbacteria bacterium]